MAKVGCVGKKVHYGRANLRCGLRATGCGTAECGLLTTAASLTVGGVGARELGVTGGVFGMKGESALVGFGGCWILRALE